jgi:ribosome-binding factor A
MPKEYARTQRVAELLQRQIAMIIQQNVDNPRAKLITVSRVEVSRDLSFAKVFVTLLGNENPEAIKDILGFLKRVTGYLRHELAGSVKLRIVPQLKFIYDESIGHGARLSQLIDEVIASDQRRNHSDDKS